MKRGTVHFVWFATLVVVILLAWWRLTSRQSPVTVKSPSLATNRVNAVAAATPVAATPTTEEVRRLRQEERARLVFQSIEGTNVPINFWGKIIDQHEHAISNAKVEYHYSTEHGNMLGVAWSKQRIEKGETVSDDSGLFSVTGFKGHYLGIETLAKEGYEYNPRKVMDFNYYGDTAAGKFVPDPRNPVLFVMVNKATAEPLVSYGGSFGKTMRLPGDGTPVRWSVWKGQPDPNGELQLTLKREPAVLARVGQPVTWAAKVEVIGGGVVEASPDDAIHRAPEEGYAPAVDYPKAEQKRGVPARSFYIKTAEGKYGRIELDLYADDDGPTARCLIKASMNPSGSRDLEAGSGGQASAR